MEASRGNVVLHFADGTKIDTWNNFTLHDSFIDPLGKLEFETAPARDRVQEYRERLTKGQLVTLLINGNSQGGFIIQEVHRSISAAGGVKFKIHCVTPLITPYQGSVDPDLAFHSQTDTPLETVILKALAPYGFDKLVSDSAGHVNTLSGLPIGGRAAPFPVTALKYKEAQAHEGETAYHFCARLFARVGCVLRMHADGSLLLSTPDYTQRACAAITQGTGPGDRCVGTIEIIDSNDDQFSQATCRGERSDDAGQTQTGRPVGTVTAAALHPERPTYQSFAAAYKPKIHLDKHARDKERCTSVATLILGSRASKAFSVGVEVDGFVSQTGAIWTVDTIVHVKIDADGIDEDMWVLERTFTLDGTGQKTKLKLLPKFALQLGTIPK